MKFYKLNYVSFYMIIGNDKHGYNNEATRIKYLLYTMMHQRDDLL